MEIFLALFVLYAIFRVVIPGMKDLDELEKNGLYRTHMGQLRRKKR